MCESKQPYEMVQDKICPFRVVIPITLHLKYFKGRFLIPQIYEAPSKSKCSHNELDISVLFAASF